MGQESSASGSGNSPEIIHVPRAYPTALIYMDESGCKATSGRIFVVGAVKLRRPGQFQRALRHLRDQNQFEGEFKFSEITRGTIPLYHQVIDELVKSDAHLAACVVNCAVYNPFGKGRPQWEVHAEVAAQLLVGCINRRELVSVMLDSISTPRGTAFDDAVRKLVNDRFDSTSVVASACLDSRSNDILQVADLVAGAISHKRRRDIDGTPGPNSHKAKIARRLGEMFGSPELRDGRTERLNIATYRAARRRTRAPKLTIIEDVS